MMNKGFRLVPMTWSKFAEHMRDDKEEKDEAKIADEWERKKVDPNTKKDYKGNRGSLRLWIQKEEYIDGYEQVAELGGATSAIA